MEETVFNNAGNGAAMVAPTAVRAKVFDPLPESKFAGSGAGGAPIFRGQAQAQAQARGKRQGGGQGGARGGVQAAHAYLVGKQEEGGG